MGNRIQIGYGNSTALIGGSLTQLWQSTICSLVAWRDMSGCYEAGL
jgi:hypothetical protein